MTSESTLLRRARILVGALLIGVVLAACGGGDDNGGGDGAVSTNEWAGRVCGDFSTWLQQIQARGGALQSSLQATGGNVQALRTQLVEFLDGFVQSTDELVTNVEAAGTPDTDDGQQIADDFTGGLERIKKAFEDARTKAEGLPTDDPQALQQGGQEIQTDLQRVSESLQQEFAGIAEKYPQLNTAFQEAPQCEQLNA